jgi:hypothetical protein
VGELAEWASVAHLKADGLYRGSLGIDPIVTPIRQIFLEVLEVARTCIGPPGAGRQNIAFSYREDAFPKPYE